MADPKEANDEIISPQPEDAAIDEQLDEDEDELIEEDVPEVSEGEEEVEELEEGLEADGLDNQITDLTVQAPRSPHHRLGGYAILARTIDKCRSTLNGKAGEYHFNCPVDNMLFSFKGIKAEDFKAAIEDGRTDEEMLIWLDANGIKKTEEEIEGWSDMVDETNPSQSTPPADWFIDGCQELGLDPNTTTLFEYLDADDEASFEVKQKA